MIIKNIFHTIQSTHNFTLDIQYQTIFDPLAKLSENPTINQQHAQTMMAKQAINNINILGVIKSHVNNLIKKLKIFAKRHDQNQYNNYLADKNQISNKNHGWRS